MNILIQAINTLLGQTQPGQAAIAITTTPAKAALAREFVISVGSTSTPVLPVNPKRANFAIKNQSAATIYVSPHNNVTIAGGSDPGWPVLSNDAEYNDTYTGAMYAICAVPGPLDLYVWEEYNP